MSASFTPEQLQKSREVLAELGEELDEPIKGPKELEDLPRYEICWLPEVTQAEEAAEIWQPLLAGLSQGQKVLWVTNSVQSCIDIYRTAKTKLTKQALVQPLIYHSRYRYFDRLKKHEAVVAAFGKSDAVLAITTQVCEMSLDLSADLLVSAIAPVAALIQRLGRLNRRMICREEGTRSALIYPWTSNKPYEQEIETGKELVRQIAGKSEISQADLAAIAVQLNSRAETGVHSRWLDDGWCSYSDSTREGSGTVTVLLQCDMANIKAAADQRKATHKDWSFMREAQGWSVPIRIPSNLHEWKRCRFYPIAPADEIFYSEETGVEPCKS